MIGQLILTVFDIGWLIAVLLLLWLIWRASTKHMHRMERALIDASSESAEAAKEAAEAAKKLASLLERQRRR